MLNSLKQKWQKCNVAYKANNKYKGQEKGTCTAYDPGAAWV